VSPPAAAPITYPVARTRIRMCDVTIEQFCLHRYVSRRTYSPPAAVRHLRVGTLGRMLNETNGKKEYPTTAGGRCRVCLPNKQTNRSETNWLVGRFRVCISLRRTGPCVTFGTVICAGRIVRVSQKLHPFGFVACRGRLDGWTQAKEVGHWVPSR
jgi:hypothetical protein